MIFIYGGFAQNKLKFALKKFGLCDDDVFDGEKNDLDKFNNEKVINHFESIIRRNISKNEDISAKINEYSNMLRESIVISQEVGCGLVPVDAEERKFRETAGRVNCILAENADEVYRVCCGIGLKQKGGDN